ncbi:MAG: AraC family transcriptional regulator [Candidatus Limiplasma sp.]|nr:AraC family transcriptional regulator [Candidatus Limiplasma sp.]
MTMLEGLNRAVHYIEEHLDQEIDYREIARIACTSQYHFQRMFGFVADMPLSEYIRRRRLTLAAFDLQRGSARILDIALKYGYHSADAFARAFQNMHGILPSKARETGVTLTAYPRILFTLSIKGVAAMNYRVEEKENFRVVGVKESVSTVDGVNFKKIPQMWADLPKETFMEILALSDRDPSGVLGVCADMDEDCFDYWIAAATGAPCPPGLASLEIPACTWAVFEATGPMPGAIQELFSRIYTEWLPTSGYEHAPAPDIEWYSDGDMGSPGYKSAVWIPLLKK